MSTPLLDIQNQKTGGFVFRFSDGWKQAIIGGLYLTLFLSLLIFGSGFVGGYTLLEALTLLLAGNVILYQAVSTPSFLRQKFDFSVLILLLWAGFLWLQLIPLSVSVVNMLSPNLINLYQRFAPFVLTSSKWIPISLATYDMWVELGKSFCYLSLFLIAHHMIQSKNELKRFGFSVIAIGVFLSLIGLAFARFSHGKIYGLFLFPNASFFTPFLNKNHFANYLVMTLPMTLAFVFLLADRSSLPTRRGFRSKFLWLASKEATWPLVMCGAFLLQLIAFLAPASRGGLLGITAAFSSFLFFSVFRFKKKIAAIFLIGSVTLLLGFSVYQVKPLVSKLRLLREASSADAAFKFRLSNWKDTLRIFSDFPLVGIGAGGFHSLFPLYKSMPEISTVSQVRFYHAENELLETLAEEGILGTGLLLLCGGGVAFRFRKWWYTVSSKTIRWLSLGIACSCIGMLAHSLTDFTFHIPANAALFAALSGVLTRFSSNRELFLAEQTNLGPSKSTLRLVLAAVFVTILFVWLAPLLWRQWRSEYYYLKAKKELNLIAEEKIVALPRVLSSYDYLLKAKKATHGDQARIHHSLGRTYTYFGLLAQKDSKRREHWFEQAETELLQSFRREPFNANHCYNLGWLYVQWQKQETAEPYLEKAMLLEPQNPFYRFQFGRNQLELKKAGSAYSVFQETLQINGAYLKLIVKLVTEFDPKITLEQLQELLPPTEQWQSLNSQLVMYFEQYQNSQRAQPSSRF